MNTRVQRRHAGDTAACHDGSGRVVVPLRGVFVLALMAGCGGAPFSSVDLTQTDGGTSNLVDEKVDQKAPSPDAHADAGHDTAVVDTDAGPVPEAAADSGMGEDTGTDAGTAGTGGTGGAGGSGGAGGTGGVTAGTGGAGGTIPCDGAGLSTHDNGVGQTWQDCVPPSTYTQDQATQACTAYCAANACTCSQSNLCSNDPGITAQIGIDAPIIAIIWTWTPQGGNVMDVRNGNPSFTCTVAGTWN